MRWPLISNEIITLDKYRRAIREFWQAIPSPLIVVFAAIMWIAAIVMLLVVWVICKMTGFGEEPDDTP
ncbi:hypothetical protein [Beijerinckia indica]|uniref:hypothetical protein n=1 Tax=Beijerinckia indica TaxID=533 RepID=UPI0005A02767|nr:hypothetical protein [Beijerinckia indica]